ncbi:MAG: TIGR04086 family membrane protein [Clostridia bacterium]|nr:TIGR04086 family membrane protein [Clostridia bacterium]
MSKSATSLSTPVKFILNCVYASLIGVILAFLFSICSALMLNFSDNPEKYYSIGAIVIKFICSIICGAVALRKNKSSALISGIVSGLVLEGFLLLASLILPGSNVFSPWNFAILPLCSVVGALFSNSK